MIEFISSVYNEENEISDLIEHVEPWVDKIHIVDDGSEDSTPDILYNWMFVSNKVNFYPITHTGLCEIGRIRALSHVADDSWVVMLDADERFDFRVLENTTEYLLGVPKEITHIYYSQHEFIDNQKVAEFAKVKVFRKSAAHLPEVIHRDPQFDGEAINLGGVVIHRKSKQKQVMREMQYLDTYEKLYDEGKVTRDDVNWFKGMHHFIKDKHG